MSLIDQVPAQSMINTAKETAAEWRGYFFPVSTEAKIVLTILAVVALWGLAIFTFGVPALVWPMKLIVPGLILSLVLLTWGM
ncbi:hypothetical protein [Roseobacter sp. CCS2]|uniref:hypothetical protein n=1 Tax=Roseobacter sp. CCS2 TaxID=391593 RepID=UPI0000F4009E|nr:hypothetical protein [Roseobacter sp. CCS2]EBA13869.1 hypothetical protein RCCS2_08269 [Roseobacter sp. CCS2]